MECQSCDSKKVTKVFDASQRKRSRKKPCGYDDANSVATDDSAIGSVPTSFPVPSGKTSLPDLSSTKVHQDIPKRDSSQSQEHSPIDNQRSPGNQQRLSRSRRRHHRSSANEGVSLALKAGLVSTPRSVSPLEEGDGGCESIPQDQDSFIYAFLEEAIKRDKKKQRHSRRREERASHDREVSIAQEHDRYCDRDRERDRDRDQERDRDRDRDRRRHHHRHRDDVPSRDHDKQSKDTALANQTLLFETFAKICAQINEKEAHGNPPGSPLMRTQSHKSLQCEVLSGRDPYDVDRQPVRLNSHTRSRDLVASRVRSQEDCSNRLRSYEKLILPNDMDRCNQDKSMFYYKEPPRFHSKLDVVRSRIHHIDDDRGRQYSQVLPMVPTRSCINPYRRQPEAKDYRDYEPDNRGRHYEEDNRKYCEHKTSRSFDVRRDYHENERVRRSARSDPRERRFDEREKRIDDSSKYYDEKALEPRERNNISISAKDRRWKRDLERYERNSVTSRDDEYNRDRDRFSERERDSGLSVADGDTSTVSGRSNYLKVVKQQISEQREAMDKMMKLWKELMRCFKGISQTQVQDKHVQESAANAHESATEQMRLWWECMRRYETVARDVGDTDARLMEEIKKQRSEMAEMATMWQECLQRYRDISNDFNSLKQQLVTPESPTRMPAPPLLCAEGEGSVVPQSYRIPVYPGQPQVPVQPPGMGGAGGLCGAGGAAGFAPPRGGSPLRGRSSAPPAWWWCDGPPRSPRRRSSPDSRASREKDKDKRHRRKDRDESRYKDNKPSKPSAARSDHRHRKR